MSITYDYLEYKAVADLCKARDLGCFHEESPDGRKHPGYIRWQLNRKKYSAKKSPEVTAPSVSPSKAFKDDDVHFALKTFAKTYNSVLYGSDVTKRFSFISVSKNGIETILEPAILTEGESPNTQDSTIEVYKTANLEYVLKVAYPSTGDGETTPITHYLLGRWIQPNIFKTFYFASVIDLQDAGDQDELAVSTWEVRSKLIFNYNQTEQKIEILFQWEEFDLMNKTKTVKKERDAVFDLNSMKLISIKKHGIPWTKSWSREFLLPLSTSEKHLLIPAVGKNLMWGYVDHTYQFIIPPQFDMADWFKNGTARVQFKDVNKTIDKTGKFIQDSQ